MKLLIIDDDTALRNSVRADLSLKNIEVSEAENGLQALEFIDKLCPDVILLDIDMPVLDGFECLIRLKKSSRSYKIPVIMLTARVDEKYVLRALELGADDYIKKPFSFAELCARIQALVRRINTPAKQYVFSDWAFNIDSRQVAYQEKTVELTQREFMLALRLAEQINIILASTSLIESVWGNDPGVTRVHLDAHLTNLRRKLTKHFGYCPIKNARGVGYAWIEKN